MHIHTSCVCLVGGFESTCTGLCPVWPLSVKVESSAEAYGKAQPSPKHSGHGDAHQKSHLRLCFSRMFVYRMFFKCSPSLEPFSFIVETGIRSYKVEVFADL